jgi:RNA polymerase sigma-70 factor (ECF subfamily)
MTVVAHGCRHRQFCHEALAVSDDLLRNARRLTGQLVDAEDLLQETLLKAYLSFDKFHHGSNLRSWLFRIMVNTWVDRYRSARRRPVEQLSVEITDAQMADHGRHSRTGLRSAESEALEYAPGAAFLALQTLSEDIQAVIYYADIEGYRNTEIAEMLGIPAGTVASRLHRGHTLLRELLRETK